MEFPKISIVTTSFNQGHYLEETILSVLNQNYPNLEYIIIDGGSTDNSIDIIKKYEKQLTFWVSEKDNGMYDAIQKGFEKSTGEIMAWINSDDWYHKKAFLVVSEIFSRFQEVDWIQGLPSIVDESGRIVFVHNFRRWSKYDFLRGEYEFIQQESCFWRRRLWVRSGGKLNTTLKYAGDFALWLHLFDFAELYCVPAILGAFRARSKDQFSVDKMSEYRDEANKLLKVRQDKMIPEEKKKISRWFFYMKFMRHIPFLNYAYNTTNIETMFPPVIFFDRASQNFIMSKQERKSFYSLVKSNIISRLYQNYVIIRALYRKSKSVLISK